MVKAAGTGGIGILATSYCTILRAPVGDTASDVSMYTGSDSTALQETACTAVVLTPNGVPGNGGEFTPQDGAGDGPPPVVVPVPPVVVPLVVVPEVVVPEVVVADVVVPEVVVPEVVVPEVVVPEVVVADVVPVVVPEVVAVVVPDVVALVVPDVVPVVLPEVLAVPVVEVPDVVLVVLCPELPCPVEPPPYIYIAANWVGRGWPSRRPGTSMGVFKSERTNSFWPL
jgi:hypothetical protein